MHSYGKEIINSKNWRHINLNGKRALNFEITIYFAYYFLFLQVYLGIINREHLPLYL